MLTKVTDDVLYMICERVGDVRPLTTCKHTWSKLPVIIDRALRVPPNRLIGFPGGNQIYRYDDMTSQWIHNVVTTSVLAKQAFSPPLQRESPSSIKFQWKPDDFPTFYYGQVGTECFFKNVWLGEEMGVTDAELDEALASVGVEAAAPYRGLEIRFRKVQSGRVLRAEVNHRCADLVGYWDGRWYTRSGKGNFLLRD